MFGFGKNLVADIYMKSGNVIRLERLNKLTVTRNDSCKVTGIQWEFEVSTTKVLYIDVGQIESVISWEE